MKVKFYLLRKISPITLLLMKIIEHESNNILKKKIHLAFSSKFNKNTSKEKEIIYNRIWNLHLIKL
jgi:hypothetical protein